MMTHRHPIETYGKSDAPSDAPSGSDLPPPSPTPEPDLPIALRKGKHTCRYLVSAFVSYDGLSTSSRAFDANLDSILVLETVDLLDDAGQIEAKPCDEPMIPKLKLRFEDGRLLHNPEKYRRVVGKLNYLTITRSNIVFSVSVVSQFLNAPRTSHWDVVTQILGYLKVTPRLGILYANHGHHIVEGFTDADYVGCPNNSRSTTGYCVFVGGNLVSWKSEIGFPQSKPMKMWCDNQICLGIDLEPDKWIKDSGCSKHMTGNRKLFSTYKAYNGGNVVFGSNLHGNIIGKGTITHGSLKIANVEHVDNSGFNLLSVGQICNSKCKVIFSKNDSEIVKDGKVIGRFIRKRGLYVMKLGKKPKDKNFLTTIDENSTLWQRRLGHANMRLIQSLASKE
ncbi:retrovirus-related pol polyprotein from transposon TNT 1-94 [Tanacetum coccineum]